MKELSIKLNQKYKSFDAGYRASIRGDLVILSGVNGSGKSQILNIILGQEGKDFRKKINSSILLNNQIVITTQIDYRSFKDNTYIQELTPSTSQSFINSGNQAWYNYNSNRLNQLIESNQQHLESCIAAKNIILQYYEENAFNNGEIPEEDFKSKLLENDFLWKDGDKFTNSIGEIFFNHALKVSELMKEVGRANYNSSLIEKSPWTKLNELFSKLKFEYRFKDDYFIKGVEINEQPKLYPLELSGVINSTEGRELADLSDGEKTIISLCFASLIGNKFSEKKLLLLDEIDSVLNPSLIEMFFAVVDEFFIKNNIMVVMSTHSPATISLSPDITKYYEVFKPNHNKTRLLEVSKDEYAELLLANKNFYDKISDQQARINQLEKSISSNVEILVVTEGKTDWKYILAALDHFHSKGKYLEIEHEYFYKFGSQHDCNEKICGTTQVNELNESKLNNYLNSLKDSRGIDNFNAQIRIGIFDSDTKITLVNDKTKNIFSMKIKPINISTEFLFNDDEIKTIIDEKRLFIGEEFNIKTKRHYKENYNLGGDATNLNKAGKRAIIEKDVYDNYSVNKALSKEKFAQNVFNKKILISEESWSNFEHIFEFILSNISKKEPVN